MERAHSLKSTPKEIAELIRKERGSTFKVDWHGAWDPFESNGQATVTWCNDGRGFLPCVEVLDKDGSRMFYVGPFSIEQMPSSTNMLMFYCTNAFFVREPTMSAPDRIAGFIRSAFGK